MPNDGPNKIKDNKSDKLKIISEGSVLLVIVGLVLLIIAFILFRYTRGAFRELF
jgi:hypothetical protein